MNKQVLDRLEAHPIIAAIRDDVGLEVALSSPVKIVFLLDATLCNLKQRVMMIKKRQKEVFIHLEMISV